MTQRPDTPSPSGTSVTLLQGLRDNTPEAWRRMAYLYAPLLRHWCARHGVRGPDADDVIQEVLRAASAGLEGFRKDRPGDSFRAWLRGITRNMALLHFRKEQRHAHGAGGTEALARLQELTEPEEPAPEESPEAESDELRRRALELVRGEFEERTWRMFWETVVAERPAADVAAEVGVSAAAVRMARSRVLRRLKEEFEELLV
jgi:RNA polymerase sigma-70 factor (ECF subfamily)